MDRDPLEKAENTAYKIGQELKKFMPKGWRFFLILATPGHGGFSTYLSDCTRQSAIELLREMADHLEKNGKEV